MDMSKDERGNGCTNAATVGTNAQFTRVDKNKYIEQSNICVVTRLFLQNKNKK